MKIRYVSSNKMDPTVRDIYIWVLKHGCKVKKTGKYEDVIFIKAKDKYRERDFLLYPENREIIRKGHGCKTG